MWNYNSQRSGGCSFATAGKEPVGQRCSEASPPEIATKNLLFFLEAAFLLLDLILGKLCGNRYGSVTLPGNAIIWKESDIDFGSLGKLGESLRGTLSHVGCHPG